MSTPQATDATPLLTKKPTTALPKFQLFILLWVQLAEPITSQVIYPFINKLVAELPITGGDETKVGYYAGLIESLFFAAEAITVLQWSRYSDHVGRKPVILTGLFGLTLSIISFGLSKSFWGLVIRCGAPNTSHDGGSCSHGCMGSRCLSGLLNGNVGVLKSMMGELTDSSNIAQGMALVPIVWNSGATVGWVHIFFDRRHTVKFDHTKSSTPTTEQEGSPTPGHVPMPLPIREVLTPRVIIAVANYASIAFLDIALRALQPLFYTSRIQYGGLGFTPAVVGTCLGAFFIFSGVYQAFVFPLVYERMGTKNAFVTSVLMFVPMFALFPLMNLSARHNGVNVVTWIELALQLILYVVMDMGFSCAPIYVCSAAPNRQSLGATNGLAQTGASVLRTIGPIASTSLYAVSVQKNIAGGWFVYIVLVFLSALALYATTYLPRTLWEPEGDDERVEE
ncbi:hypothetical protein HWV62_38981 [Athelia sp. TMB]|nr:hypothetical protein HWV62_38981 [Athelia sp. TMB]